MISGKQTNSPHLLCHSNSQTAQTLLMEVESSKSVKAIHCGGVDAFIVILFTLFYVTMLCSAMAQSQFVILTSTNGL